MMEWLIEASDIQFPGEVRSGTRPLKLRILS